MSVRIPKYRHHKPSGQALVSIRGKRIYLGKHGSEASQEKYRRLIAELMSDEDDSGIQAAETVLTINAVILRYFRFAKTYYVKNGKPTDEIAALRAIFRRLKNLYGHTDAAEFGPKSFKTLRETLIQEKLSRKYINDCMGRVRRMFRWAVVEELVPSAVYQALAAVSGLRQGRSQARETAPIEPVTDETVEATLPHLPEVVADMVRLQRLTGMRPAEVCLLRPCDLDRDGKVWIYSPPTHKTEHKNKQRKIPIGPRAQAILLRYLARDSKTYCFRPQDSEARRLNARHRQRTTPLSAGNKPQSNRVIEPKRRPGAKYTTSSYRRAIQRASVKAFPPAKELPSEQVKEWNARHRWSPNQLRHTAATEIRGEFGLEAAQVLLGHSNANVTQIYAERDLAKALEIALRVG